MEALSSVAVGLIIWYGGGEIIRGALTFGALVAFIQYMEKFFSPIRDLSAKYSIMQGAMAALERIFGLLDMEKKGENVQQNEDLPGFQNLAGLDSPFETIEFRDVWFAYKDEEYVLKGFNLKIRRGEKIALVGETGGGKTTVTRLLSRFYEVNRGSILINGCEIREIPLPELRGRIGVVLQEPFLFTGSLEHNITLGDEERAPADGRSRSYGGSGPLHRTPAERIR